MNPTESKLTLDTINSGQVHIHPPFITTATFYNSPEKKLPKTYPAIPQGELTDKHSSSEYDWLSPACVVNKQS